MVHIDIKIQCNTDYKQIIFYAYFAKRSNLVIKHEVMLLLQSVTTSITMNGKQFWETFKQQQAVSKDKSLQFKICDKNQP